MKTSAIILAVLGAVFGIILLIAFAVLGTVNKYSRLEVRAGAEETNNKNILDNTRKMIREAGVVAKEEVAALEKLIVGYAKARGQNGGGGDNNVVSIGMVQEAVPSITSVDTIKRLSNIASAGRIDWQNAQSKLIEIKRQGDDMLKQQPSGFILSLFGKKEIKVTIITSDETEENFATGKDNSKWLEESK
jgi:hypothetical protein